MNPPRLVWIAVCPECGPVWASEHRRRLDGQTCGDHHPSLAFSVHRYELVKPRRQPAPVKRAPRIRLSPKFRRRGWRDR